MFQKHIIPQKTFICVFGPEDACQAPRHPIPHKPNEIELPIGSLQYALIEIDRKSPGSTPGLFPSHY
jgi:hypothetical protein